MLPFPAPASRFACRSLRNALFALLLLAFAPACGSDQKSGSYNIALNGHAIVWAGYANADQNLKSTFDVTVSCLRSAGQATRPGYAMIYVVDGTFYCSGILARGCTEINGPSIYITKDYRYTDVFTHEVVHWETGMGNEYHNTPQFEMCSSTLQET